MFVLLSLYFRLICVLSALFLTIGTLAQALGRLKPPHPALEGFVTDCDDKPQPCWYGIVVGQTTWEEAQPALQATGYADSPTNAAPRPGLCDVSTGLARDERRTITIMRLVPCPGLRLGDAAGVFGPPDGLAAQSGFFNPLFVYERAFNVSAAVTETHSLHTPVFSVDMRAADPDYVGVMVRWRGFLNRERYCKDEPQIWYCRYN